jgi:hypothetical protein
MISKAIESKPDWRCIVVAMAIFVSCLPACRSVAVSEPKQVVDPGVSVPQLSFLSTQSFERPNFDSATLRTWLLLHAGVEWETIWKSAPDESRAEVLAAAIGMLDSGAIEMALHDERLWASLFDVRRHSTIGAFLDIGLLQDAAAKESRARWQEARETATGSLRGKSVDQYLTEHLKATAEDAVAWLDDDNLVAADEEGKERFQVDWSGAWAEITWLPPRNDVLRTILESLEAVEARDRDGRWLRALAGFTRRHTGLDLALVADGDVGELRVAVARLRADFDSGGVERVWERRIEGRKNQSLECITASVQPTEAADLACRILNRRHGVNGNAVVVFADWPTGVEFHGRMAPWFHLSPDAEARKQLCASARLEGENCCVE